MHIRHLAVLLLSSLPACSCQGNTTEPVEAAQKYAADLGLGPVQGISCTTADSDNDGYVSCDLYAGQPRAHHALQCAGLGAMTHAPGCQPGMIPVTGCKAYRPQLVVPTVAP